LVLLKGQEEAAALDAEVGSRVDLMLEEMVCHHVLLSPAAGSSNRAPDAPTETRFTGTRSPAHGVVMSHTRKWQGMLKLRVRGRSSGDNSRHGVALAGYGHGRAGEGRGGEVLTGKKGARQGADQQPALQVIGLPRLLGGCIRKHFQRRQPPTLSAAFSPVSSRVRSSISRPPSQLTPKI